MLEESLGLLSVGVGAPSLLLAIVFWTGMFFLCVGVSKAVAPVAYAALTREDRIFWDNYAFSFTHGIIGFIGAVRCVQGIFPGVPDSQFDSTPLQRFYIQLTLAFFIVDTFFLVRDWNVKGNAMILIHHVIFPLTYGTGLYLIQPAFGMYVMAVLQLAEITTPFLHIRWFMSKLGYKSSILYAVNGLVFALLFLAVRGGLLTVMYYRVWVTLPHPLYWPGCDKCTLVMTCAWVFQALQYKWCVDVALSAAAFFISGDRDGRDSRKKPAKRD